MKKQYLMLSVLGALAIVLTAFSYQSRQGALDGLMMSINTIIPSLLPLLIIFLLIMKSGARDALGRLFGFVAVKLFNLPHTAITAIVLGLVGGYPTGALLTKELFDSGDISANQARRIMRFNFCGGCGFIITALGTAGLGSSSAGLILFASNVISAIVIGFALSFIEKRERMEFYSFSPNSNGLDVLNDATLSAVRSVLSITAIVTLFSAFTAIVPISDTLLPLIEITSGLCGRADFSITQTAAYLSFGGICIHLQILGTIKQFGMKYFDFFCFRIIGAVISYGAAWLLARIFPSDVPVFSSIAQPIEASSMNTALSVLMILGCFVIVLDVREKKIRI